MRHILVQILVFVGCLLLFGSNPFRSQHISTPAVHAQEGCSVATLRGAYGFFRTGATGVGPLGAVGIATFDGAGTSTGRQTIRKNGVTTSDLFTDPPLIAPYEVNSDCTGKFLNSDGSAFSHFVLVDGGRELFIISLSTGNTVTGVMKKIETE
jgi:hypothetical protein